MKLVSMKLSRKESKDEMAGPAAMVDKGPLYPWGLSISLDQDALAKLGLDYDDFEVGKSMKLEATVEVTSVSQNETQGGGESQSCCLQITDMDLSGMGTSDDKIKSKLYADKD